MKPLHTLVIGDDKYTIYVGLLALAANIIIAGIVNVILSKRK